MELENRKKFIVNFLYFVIILGIVIVLTRYALGMLMPFLIALVVSLLLKPVVAFLRDKCHFHKGFAGGIVVALFYALVGFLLIVLGVQVFTAAKAFFLTLPGMYTYSIAPWLAKIFAELQAFVAKLDPETAAAYNVVASNVTQTLGQTVANISKQVVAWVTSITFKTPAFLLHLLIAVIATFFLSIDFPKLKAFLMLQLSEQKRDLVHNIRVHLGRTLWRYTRSYALILVITFSEISLGLLIIGIKCLRHRRRNCRFRYPARRRQRACTASLDDYLTRIGQLSARHRSWDFVYRRHYRAKHHRAKNRRRPRRSAPHRHPVLHGGRNVCLRRHRASRPANYAGSDSKPEQAGRHPSL